MEYLTIAISAALQGGAKILEIYQTADFQVEHKEDNSPLTLADKQSHRIITRILSSCEIPVLSEEGRNIPYAARRNWERMWIVDPLDGTKEFIKRNGEFTVNIALVEQNQPILGVVYVPAKDILYFGRKGFGAYRLEKASETFRLSENQSDLQSGLDKIMQTLSPLPLSDLRPSMFTIVGSRSHPSAELDAFVKKMEAEQGRIDFIAAGSALKICLVAEGSADIYPRLGPTMEWDTAAGQAVAEAAGAEMLDYGRGAPLTYNKENLLNPWFVVRRKA